MCRRDSNSVSVASSIRCSTDSEFASWHLKGRILALPGAGYPCVPGRSVEVLHHSELEQVRSPPRISCQWTSLFLC